MKRHFLNRYFLSALLLITTLCGMRAQQHAHFLTKEQALSDIDSLIYTISEIHPDMFSVCNQGEFFQLVGKTKEEIPDSLTAIDLYKRIAPIVTKIGDGHTSLFLPSSRFFNKQSQRMPLLMNATENHRLLVKSCIENKIPAGSEIISINGMSSQQIINAMLPYASGEKDFYKIESINNNMALLFELLFNAQEYKVVYCLNNRKNRQKIKLSPVIHEQMEKAMPKQQQSQSKNKQPYSFRINDDNTVAIMDFNSFSNPDRMGQFADSMFTTLRNNNIKKLIIDVRNNSGGNSEVGDTLLKYISPRPFAQMGKVLIRISERTKQITGITEAPSGWYFFDEPDENRMIKPMSAEQGRYDGQVYLLTSHYTFSSASSFSWTFKQFGMGTIIGEETGGMNVHFGDILRYTLPYSKLRCYISYKRFWLYGADEANIHGTLPDIKVPAEEALDAALKK